VNSFHPAGDPQRLADSLILSISDLLTTLGHSSLNSPVCHFALTQGCDAELSILPIPLSVCVSIPLLRSPEPAVSVSV
jgi:hypothetical protein